MQRLEEREGYSTSTCFLYSNCILILVYTVFSVLTLSVMTLGIKLLLNLTEGIPHTLLEMRCYVAKNKICSGRKHKREGLTCKVVFLEFSWELSILLS